MAVLQTLMTRAKNSKTLKLSLNPPKIAPCARASHGAGRVEIEMLLRLNVTAAVLKLQGEQDRVPYRSIVNATDRHVT